MNAATPAPALRSDVVALYVDPRGPYPKLVSEWFDAKRDARTYTGSLPVVAHPPCGPWGRLRHLSRKDDPQLAIDAVAQVRCVGGILEHPRGSLLFTHCGIPKPCGFDGIGWTFEVDQCAWGHVARKTTWLYCVGLPGSIVTLIRHGGTVTHWIGGFRIGHGRRPTSTYSKTGRAVPPGIKVCSAEQRRRTPIAFAEWLLEVASRARVKPIDQRDPER